MTELNATALIADVRNLAAESPKRRAHCTYVTRQFSDSGDEGALRPECIMGHALVRAGVDIDLLNVGRGIVAFFEKPDKVLGSNYTVTYTDEELDWLSRVQYYQDRGKPWAEAVYFADKHRGVTA